MSAGEYWLGVVLVVAFAGAATITARALRRLLLPGWSGAPAILATAILAIAIAIVVSEALGLIGLLSAPALLGVMVVIAAAASRIDPGPPSSSELRDPPPRSERSGVRHLRPEMLIAVALAVLVAAQWAAPTLLALDRGIYGGDSLWYHMPFAAHIAQSGSITELLYTDPLYLNWFYPQISELLHADGLLLFGNDFLSPLLNLGFLALALLAGWCIGRPYGAQAPAAAAVAALMASDLIFSRQPGNANNDVVVIAFLLAAAALLINLYRPGRAVDGDSAASASADLPGGRPTDLPIGLAVAGLAAGLALGTKLTAVVPVAALTIGVVAISRPGMRIRSGLIWTGALAAVGGVWFARNLVVSGSPLPFLDLGVVDKVSELGGRPPFSVLHYATDTGVWGRYFVPGLEERLGDLWPLFLALAVVGVLASLAWGGRVERMLAAVAAVAALGYLLTPLGASGHDGMPVGFRLNLRYLAPGLAIGIVLAAISPAIWGARSRPGTIAPGDRPADDRAGWWRAGALALFSALIVSAGVLGEIDSDRLGGTSLIVIVLVGMPVATLLFRGRLPARAIVAGTTAVAVAVVLVGRGAADTYLEQRYSTSAPEYPRAEHPATELGLGLGAAFEWARGTADARIALTGSLGGLYQYGLWGREATNEVRFLGNRGPRGTFTAFRSCPEFVAALNAGDFDYLVTTPIYDQDNPAASRPAAEGAILKRSSPSRRVAGAGLVDVWELGGPIDPPCPR